MTEAPHLTLISVTRSRSDFLEGLLGRHVALKYLVTGAQPVSGCVALSTWLDPSLPEPKVCTSRGLHVGSSKGKFSGVRRIVGLHTKDEGFWGCHAFVQAPSHAESCLPCGALRGLGMQCADCLCRVAVVLDSNVLLSCFNNRTLTVL